jgi:endoglucanase
MGVDRRTFSAGLVLALTAACNIHNPGKAQSGDTWWRTYRDRFLDPSGRIIDTGNGSISHSEGQGYGMLLATAHGDQEAFDRMAKWTQATLAGPGAALHAWRYDPGKPDPIPDKNNATDGDILIAWALDRAGRQWNRADYSRRAAEIRSAIYSGCVVRRFGRQVLLPGVHGFTQGETVVFNPSYFVWSALDSFRQRDGEQVWGRLISDSEDLLRLTRFGEHNLPTDWAVLVGRDEVMPAPDRPAQFGYDAIRIALYGRMGARTKLIEPIAAYWRDCFARSRMIPAWINVVSAEAANYAVSDGGAAIAALVLGSSPPAQLSRDYYAASLQMLVRMAIPAK